MQLLWFPLVQPEGGAPALKCPGEEPTPANEDDKQALHSKAKGTRLEGGRGQGMKQQHLCSHLTG